MYYGNQIILDTDDISEVEFEEELQYSSIQNSYFHVRLTEKAKNNIGALKNASFVRIWNNDNAWYKLKTDTNVYDIDYVHFRNLMLKDPRKIEYLSGETVYIPFKTDTIIFIELRDICIKY